MTGSLELLKSGQLHHHMAYNHIKSSKTCFSGYSLAKLVLLPVLLITIPPFLVSSQNALPTALQQMAKLDFLVGEWRGTGWEVNWDGSRGVEFSQKTRVQIKNSGATRQIKQERKYKTTGSVHTSTLDASIYYDETWNIYRWRGENVYARKNPLEAKLVDTRTFQYGIPFTISVELPNGARRTTITVTESGEWRETLDVWKIDRWYKVEESILSRAK